MIEEPPEPDKGKGSNKHIDIQRTRMLMTAMALGQNINDLWDLYTDMFRLMDLDDPTTHNMMEDMLLEFECNLNDMMNEVQEQIYNVVGIYEYPPVDIVEDFESSILRDIGKLGDIDLDNYRIEYDDDAR
jgi:hypothetical protein